MAAILKRAFTDCPHCIGGQMAPLWDPQWDNDLQCVQCGYIVYHTMPLPLVYGGGGHRRLRTGCSASSQAAAG